MEVKIEKVEGESLQLGGSLAVDNVQALAASGELTEIPCRYIRPKVVEDVLSIDDDEIPILDLSKLLDVTSFGDEATKLKSACADWGFFQATVMTCSCMMRHLLLGLDIEHLKLRFQLINHGVPNEVIERLKVVLHEFFDLPLEEKKAFAQLPGSIEGYGQAFVLSDDQELDWADMYFLATQPVGFRNMRFWPSHPPSFRDTLDKYSSELKRVADCLLGSMAKSLGFHASILDNLFDNGLLSARINYYPPCCHANQVLGLSPHSDSVGLTLLLLVNEEQGLQIKRDGGWLPIWPIPSAFIVNVGDILELLSNGIFKSIEHRAVINPEKQRLSIAMFHNPNYDVSIGPLPKLVEGTEKCYETVSHESFLKLVLSNKLDGKSLLDQMKLKK